MVSSLDGFIAKKDGDVTWLQSNDSYENGVVLTEEAINEFLKKIDCYVMGAHTYEQALELGWPYGDVPVFVLTHRNLTSKRNSVQFYSGVLTHFVQNILQPNYQNVWLVGGAELTRNFIQERLVNEIVISIMPVLLGEGLPFFDNVKGETNLHLLDVKAYKDGMVELTYQIREDSD